MLFGDAAVISGVSVNDTYMLLLLLFTIKPSAKVGFIALMNTAVVVVATVVIISGDNGNGEFDALLMPMVLSNSNIFRYAFNRLSSHSTGLNFIR